MSEKLTCPRCGGEGLIEVYNEAGCPYPQRDTCPDCHGTGVVPHEEVDETITIDLPDYVARIQSAEQRVGELEAVLEAAIANLAVSGSCPSDVAVSGNSCLDRGDRCAECWHDYLFEQQGKEAVKNHA